VPPASGSAAVYATVSDIGDPSPLEQELVELANRARRDPVAEGNRLGLNLAGYPPMPPLAPNGLLAKAARGHSLDMAANKYFGHVDPAGLDPAGRITGAGYVWLACGENIFARTPSAPDDAKQCHSILMIDPGLNPPGHRYNILGVGVGQALYREIGCSLVQNNAGAGAPYDTYVTQDFGCQAASNPILTGVVFADANGSGEYDAGEGMGGVAVKLTAPNGNVVQTMTRAAGGYAFQVVAAGNYTIEFSGGNIFPSPVSAAVTIGTANVKVDGIAGTGIVLR
jgi:uncharacterized protein YkwD